MSKSISVQCPSCQKKVDHDTNEKLSKSFPFCSMKCKTLDLGAWIEAAEQADREEAELYGQTEPDLEVNFDDIDYSC